MSQFPQCASLARAQIKNLKSRRAVAIPIQPRKPSFGSEPNRLLRHTFANRRYRRGRVRPVPNFAAMPASRNKFRFLTCLSSDIRICALPGFDIRPSDGKTRDFYLPLQKSHIKLHQLRFKSAAAYQSTPKQGEILKAPSKPTHAPTEMVELMGPCPFMALNGQTDRTEFCRLLD